MNNIKLISTNDGGCILFNFHLTEVPGRAIIFPADDGPLDKIGKFLFRTASTFPEQVRNAAGNHGYEILGPNARCFGSNAGYEQIIDLFDIGARAWWEPRLQP